jgi:hypothetical protein
MLNLITAAQAVALLPGLSAAEAVAVCSFCGSASRAIEKWCRHALAYASYVEFHRPEATRKIRLNNPPVIAGTVELRTELNQVAQISCVDPAARRATATLTATSLTLARSSPATPAPVILTLAGYPTVGGLCAAISATPGWSAAVNPSYANWLTADVEPNPGAMGALGSTANLLAFTHDLSNWSMDDPLNGIIELQESRPQAFRFPDRTWGGAAVGFGGGGWGSSDPRSANVRSAYQAGYDPAGVLAPMVPDDLQQAVALTIRAALDSGQFSGVLKSIELGNSKVEINSPMAVPDAAKGFASAYVLRRF